MMETITTQCVCGHPFTVVIVPPSGGRSCPGPRRSLSGSVSRILFYPHRREPPRAGPGGHGVPDLPARLLADHARDVREEIFGSGDGPFRSQGDR